MFTIEESKFTESSGNVFADLGQPDAGMRMAKAQLAQRISEAIQVRRLTQREAAEMLGIDRPKIVAITRGRLADFSLDRLKMLADGMGVAER